MICRRCGEVNSDNSAYCIECGSLLVMPDRQVISYHNKVNAPTIECPHCHQSNPTNNMFCTNCRKNMKYEAVDKRPLGNRIAGGVLGWLLWPVGVMIYGFLILVIGQAITSIGLAIGLPFDNDIAAFIIFGSVTFAVPIIFILLLNRDWSRKK